LKSVLVYLKTFYSGQCLPLQTKLPDEFIDARRRLRIACQLGT
jgi:hypothetical protein